LQLREKSKAPQDIVDAVHNLGDTSANMGQYDQAISYYLRAIDLRRQMNDQRGAAIESESLGIIFDYQGRFGAAVKSEQDALKTFQGLNDQSDWMPRMMDASAEALILAGRGDEAKSDIEEAVKLSRQLKNDSVMAEAFGVQGDGFFYQGEFKSAQRSYEQALEAAKRSKEPATILIANSRLAKALVGEKQSQGAIALLKPLQQRADDLGLKYASVECSVWMAEAMIQGHDYAAAQQELKRALLRSDQLGMQPLSARAHYLLAIAERKSGDRNDAQPDDRQALALLDGMKKDPGAEKILQRSDFKAMYEQASH
jgi:eukaryotic-like serine/threonine-protein kinase